VAVEVVVAARGGESGGQHMAVERSGVFYSPIMKHTLFGTKQLSAQGLWLVSKPQDRIRVVVSR
jgi:hypothetical protein